MRALAQAGNLSQQRHAERMTPRDIVQMFCLDVKAWTAQIHEKSGSSCAHVKRNRLIGSKD
jgi:hypothetical protein